MPPDSLAIRASDARAEPCVEDAIDCVGTRVGGNAGDDVGVGDGAWVGHVVWACPEAAGVAARLARPLTGACLVAVVGGGAGLLGLCDGSAEECRAAT